MAERAELRRLYLIHSFRLMINLSLPAGHRMPDYVKNAINYFGKSLKPGGTGNWLLLKQPELYSNLIKIKARTSQGARLETDGKSN